MVSREQFIKGILTYADREVIPYLPTAGKWGIGSIILIAKSRLDCVIIELIDNPLMIALGIIDKDGMIDVDLLSSALIDSSEKYGKIEITIPMMGNLSFSTKDVEKLNEYIIGGN